LEQIDFCSSSGSGMGARNPSFDNLLGFHEECSIYFVDLTLRDTRRYYRYISKWRKAGVLAALRGNK
jgi:hypothetical protein